MKKYIYIFIALSLLIAKTNKDSNLGREKDPKVAEDVHPITMWFKKTTWEFLTGPGIRKMAKLFYPKTTITHFEIEDNVVAFTIDDGFCGIDNPEGDMTEKVRQLFKKYNAKATFFVTGSHSKHTEKEDILNLLKDGHEIANHSMYDWPYNKYSEEDFIKDLDETERVLSAYRAALPRWYRAPHAKFSRTMDKVIQDRGMVHIIADAFAIDTSIPDPNWISEYILNKVKPGSIILIHMPEKGVREWNYEAMELTLEALSNMNFDIVTVSELHDMQ